jgi:uncharacterized protein (DUF58 family)
MNPSATPVPGRALVWGAVLVALPACTAAGLDAALALPAALALLLCAVFALVDMLIAVSDSRHYSVRAPEIVTFTRNHASALPLDILRDPPREVPIRLSVEFPEGMQAEKEVIELSGLGQVPIRLTPAARGKFRIERCHIEVPSRARLWMVRAALPISVEMRVYPDLRGDRTTAALLRSRHPGVHHFRQVGRGREFERLRDYLPGDTFDEISWKATARHGRPVVKVFQVERTQEIYVILDSSRLSARHDAIEDFVKASLLLGLAAQQHGDKYGLVVFSDRVHDFVRAGSGKAQYAACRDALYRVQPRRVSPDFAELFTFLQLRLRRRALLIFLTALDDPLLAETFARDLPLLTRRHLAVVALMEQPEVQLVFEGPRPERASEVYRSLAGHLMWTELRETRKTLERHGVLVAQVEPERAGAQLAELYESIKQRQLL